MPKKGWRGEYAPKGGFSNPGEWVRGRQRATEPVPEPKVRPPMSEKARLRALALCVEKYGITIADYENMLAAQEGVCAICKRAEWRASRLSIDHCHETGKVRALLCSRCNTSIGQFEDSPSLLRIAAAYLERHGK